MHTCQHSFIKSFKSMVGSISFQEISYAGKPQVVSSYILSNLCAYLPILLAVWMGCQSCDCLLNKKEPITLQQSIYRSCLRPNVMRKTVSVKDLFTRPISRYNYLQPDAI